MEKARSESKLPSTSGGTKTQEEANRLAKEETALRKEEERFLQEELDKLLSEKGTVKPAEQFPRRASQESKASQKLRGQPAKAKMSAEKPSREMKPGTEEDLLTLLDEPWDLPVDRSRHEMEDPWDKLSLLDESMLELRTLQKQDGASRPGDAVRISVVMEEDEEVEEEKKKGGRPPAGAKEEHLVQMSAKGGRHLMEPVRLDYPEKDEKGKPESKHSLWSMRSNIATMFEHKIQYLHGLKDSIQKKKISTLPFGYFSKLSKFFTRGSGSEKGQIYEQAETEED